MSKPSAFSRTQLNAAILSLLSPGLAMAAPVSWTSGTGFWDIVGNWSSSPALPGAADDVTVNVSGTQTITLRSNGGAQSINSINMNGGDEILLIDSNVSLALNGAVTANNATGASVVNQFRQSANSTLTGAGNMTVSAAATLGGNIEGSGTLITQGSTTLNSSLRLDGGRIWQNDGTVTKTAIGSFYLNNNNSGSNANLAGRIINNGLFDLQNDGGTTWGSNQGGTGVIDNTSTGIFRKSGGTGNSAIEAVFNNAGVVDVQIGTLSLNAGGVHTGDFEIATGATLQFGGGTHDLNAGSISADGRVLVSAGTLNVNTAYTIAGLTELTSAGSLVLNDDATTGSLTKTGGTLTGSGDLTVSGAAALGGNLEGSGTLITQGASTISSSLSLDGGRIWQNDGTATQTGNAAINLNTNNSGANANVAGRILNNGVLDFQGDGFVTWNSSAGGTGVIDNSGTGIFRKSIGTSTSSIQTTFNNAGTVQAQSGTLNLSAGGTHTGDFEVASGATLQFGGGTHDLNGGGMTADGRVLVSGGTLNVNTAYTIAGLTELTSGGSLVLNNDATTGSLIKTGGTLTGSGDLTVSGAAALGGNLEGSGTLITQGVSTISSSLSLDGGRIWQNDGTATQTGNAAINLNTNNSGANANVAGRILNNGVLDFQGDGFVTWNSSVGGTGVIDNSGTGIFRKSIGTSTSNIQTTFNNAGTVQAQSGTLNLSAGGTHTGDFEVASGATLQFGGGTHDLNGGGMTADGRILVSGGTLNVNTTYTIAGQTELTGGRLVLNDDASTGSLIQSGGNLSGSGNFIVTGQALLQGALEGGGRLVTQADTEIRNGFSLDGGSVWQNDGTATKIGNVNIILNTNNVGDNANAAGRIVNNGVLDFQGDGFVTWNTSIGGTGVIDNTSTGTFRKSDGINSSNILATFNNAGTVEAESGTLAFLGAMSNLSGNSLSGGLWRVQADAGETATLDFQQSNSAITTNAADIYLVGANSLLQARNASNQTRSLEQTLQSNQGALRLQQGRSYTAIANSGNFSNTGILELSDSQFNANSLVNHGTVQSFGNSTLSTNLPVSGNGDIAASFGRLIISRGVNMGSDSSLTSNDSATIDLSNATQASQIGTLNNNGSLELGSQNIVVNQDYTNANFGSGNSFNARANVIGSGQILAGGDTAQQLNGDVTNGGAASVSMSFGNIHEGDSVTRNYRVANTGVNGAALRGAVQTTVNGGNLTDSRLSGSGVTAANFGPVGRGTDTGDLGVTLTGTTAGALSSQSVTIINNFDNVAEQVLSISGAVYRYADPGLSPLNISFNNAHVGDARTQSLTLANNAVNDGFSEALNASFGAVTGNALTNGQAVTLLGSLQSATNMAVSLDTSVAGARSGSAVVQLESDGSGSSGLGITALADQLVELTGNVYRLAAANLQQSDFNLGNLRVGDTTTQTITLQNLAAADGFSEHLNAGFSATSGNLSASGTVNLLGPNASNTNSLAISLDTSVAGVRAGQATLTLVSDGSLSSGLGQTTLSDANISATANVYRLAEAEGFTPVAFGNRHVGDTVSQLLTITNQALADGYSEALNVSIASQTGDALASGSINQLAAGSFDGSSINIGMDTSSVGAKSGQVNFALASDGTGTSGLNTLALSGQLVNVSGLIYGYANPFIQQTSLDLGARRVGDAATTASIVIANQAPADLLHEGLDAALSSTPVGFSASGNSITDLRPATDGALGVSFNAATAGNYSGQATIALASNGTISNLENTALTDGQVNLSGRVYAAAVANLSLPAVDFGIVHVGDTVSNQSVTLSNTASGSLTDNLSGQYNNTAAPFNLSGNLDNIAAGNSANLNIALNTSTAGIYSNNTTLSLVSRNAEMADLALADQTLGLSAQVNNYANPELLLTSGNVGFNFIGGEYVLDFGNLQQGSTPVSISLSLANSVIGPADALRGSFDTSGVNAFSLTGFNSFSGIEAGQTLEGLLIEFLPATLGIFQNTATVSLFGYNASGYDAHIVDIRLVMNGQVSAVPLPASAWFMLSGLGIILAGKRRQLRVG